MHTHLAINAVAAFRFFGCRRSIVVVVRQQHMDTWISVWPPLLPLQLPWTRQENFFSFLDPFKAMKLIISTSRCQWLLLLLGSFQWPTCASPIHIEWTTRGWSLRANKRGLILLLLLLLLLLQTRSKAAAGSLLSLFTTIKHLGLAARSNVVGVLCLHMNRRRRLENSDCKIIQHDNKEKKGKVDFLFSGSCKWDFFGGSRRINIPFFTVISSRYAKSTIGPWLQ